jgi:hypothetical protein
MRAGPEAMARVLGLRPGPPGRAAAYRNLLTRENCSEAEDLLQGAPGTRWPALAQDLPLGDPERYVRGILVNASATDRRNG